MTEDTLEDTYFDPDEGSTPERSTPVPGPENLTEEERITSLKNLLSDNNLHDTSNGIIRQILDDKSPPLTDKQSQVFSKHIQPAMTEKCAVPRCKNETLASEDYCGTCNIEYGNQR
ncbi:MAG: hypothetical protein ACTJHW_09030 [Paenalcaligenes sp.]